MSVVAQFTLSVYVCMYVRIDSSLYTYAYPLLDMNVFTIRGGGGGGGMKGY